MLSFVGMQTWAYKFPKFPEHIGKAHDEPDPNGRPNIRRELAAHCPALNRERKFVFAEIGFHSNGGCNIAEQPIGGEVHTFRSENDNVKYKFAEDERHDTNNNNSHYGAYQDAIVSSSKWSRKDISLGGVVVFLAII